MLLDEARGLIREVVRLNFMKLTKEDHDDIEQDAMIKLHKAWDRLDHGNIHGIKSYVSKTARNAGLDFIRRGRSRVKTSRIAPDAEEFDGGWCNSAVEARPSVELGLQIQEFFGELTGNERLYWQMRAKGMTLAEMGDATGRNLHSWRKIGKKVYKKWSQHQDRA